MSDSKYDVSQTETGVSPTPAKKRTCATHCRRFWWLHLLIFAAVIILVVCLIIFVGVPNISQSKMNAAELDIQGVHVLQTRADSYLMQINSTITTDGSIHADIDPFDGYMSLADIDGAKPFATLRFPATTADRHQVVNISQTIQIRDKDAFNKFNTVFFHNEKLRVRVQGKTQVQPAGLTRKYDVDFNKVLEVNGLNLLKGTNVTDGNVNIAALKGTPNFKGTAEIPNISHFTLDIGNATFINYADEQDLGKLTINNLILRPGKNVVAVEAELDQLKVLDIISKRPYCENGIVPFKLMGSDVVNMGETLDYFATALASANQTVSINIGSFLEKAIDGYKVACKKS
ncbi:hypothetical protein CDD83_11169 [Cordyceps sp. RAO-2017]|nr:hypothetical protein CDD83_11169 [Cordyceps sp. RAO-2017]